MAPHPWERQAGESDPAWEAFVTYRDFGPSRSTAKVAQQLGKSKSLMDRWSSAHSWVERVRVWDEYMDAERRRATLDTVRQMAERHATSSQAAIRALLIPAEALVRRLSNRGEALTAELEEMSAEELISLAARAAGVLPRVMEAERLSRGQATQRTEVIGPDHMEVLFDDEEAVASVLAILGEAGIVPTDPDAENEDRASVDSTTD